MRAAFRMWPLLLLVACGDDASKAKDAGGDTGVPCERDDVDEPEGALSLAAEGAEGFLCPIGDVDWYRFSTGPNDHLLHVTLAMDGDLSPVEPAYVIWSIGPDGAPLAVAAATPPSDVGFPLDEVHCVAPGEYLVAIRDDGEDAQDFRRSYQLALSSAVDPDPAEPNDSVATAATLTTEVTGAIACVGDTDYYGFDAGTSTTGGGRLARVRLTMPIGGFEPSVRLLDDQGVLLATKENPSGSVRETDLTLETILPKAGRFTVIVADNDGKNADPEVQYTLTLTLADDSDPNEPNGHPDTATPLPSIACGDTWSAWIEASGNIGAAGDNDWFHVPLGGCAPQGILEAEVEMQESGLGNAARWTLASKVQLALTIVREHTQSPCSSDLGCQALTKTCDNDWDCSGLFNTCLPDGFCAGAGVCLPEGSCGANVVQDRFEPPAAPADPNSIAPPAHKAVVSTPLFGDTFVDVRVADFQSDGGDVGASYRLRVRTRAEPDVHEPSNVYAPTILQSFPVGVQSSAAGDIPVHDCTTDGVTPADCCGPDTWIEGVLSYENDLDWYRYAHPCPGEDCNLRVAYELESGPVDFVLSVYQGDGLWFGGIAGASNEATTQSAVAGSYGGTSQCFYSYSGHVGEPFNYYVAVRDLADVRDWSADQHYRFCVEKVSATCAAPCKLYENGCGLP